MPAKSLIADLLLDVPTQPQLWGDVLNGLTKTLDVQSISYGVAIAHRYDPEAILWGTTRGVTANVERDFQRLVYQHHPGVSWLHDAQPGDVLARWNVDEAFANSHPAVQEFENTAAMRGLQRRGGVLVSLAASDGLVAWLSFNRAREHRVSLQEDLPKALRSLAPIARTAALQLAILARERRLATTEAAIEALFKWHVVVNGAGLVVQDVLDPRSRWIGSSVVDYSSHYFCLPTASTSALLLALARQDACEVVLEDQLAHRRQRISVGPISRGRAKCLGLQDQDRLFSVGAQVTPQGDALDEACKASPLMRTLSPTESVVARHIVGGLCAKQIASELEVSVATVRTHISHILDKTQSRSQVDFLRRVIA